MSLQSGTPERRDVIDVLKGHGVSGAATARAWDEARRLVSETRRRGIEHAVTLDAESGAPIGARLTGTRSSTDLRAYIARFQAGREYLQLHTHPGNTSFSANDLTVFVTQPGIRTMAVVGLDRAWHVVSRATEQVSMNRRDTVDAFLTELARLEAAGAAFEQRPHRAMLRVSAQRGLRYDRLGGERHG